MWWLLACAAPAWTAWEELGSDCPIEVAGPEVLAAAWAPCGAGCEQLQLPTRGRLDQEPELTRTATGVRLAVTVTADDQQDHFLVDEAGTVEAVVRRPGAWNAGCWVMSVDLSPDTWTLRARLAPDGGSARDGQVDHFLRVGAGRLTRDTGGDRRGSTWTPRRGLDGADWWLEAPRRAIWRGKERVWSPEGGADGITGPVARGPDGLVVALRSAGAINLWTFDTRGASPWPGEGPRGEVGSDGADLVWTAGVDRATWTAPWGHPEAARRLGPAPEGDGSWVVGDKLAAHAAVSGLEVVGIDDGRARPIDAAAAWAPLRPLGIHDGWVYTRAWGNAGGIVRLRAD